MAGTTIGEVNINLRMNLAQFKKDVQDGTNDARSAANQIGSSIGEGTMQGREALALLGEEIGVSIPRGIRSMLAELPGVGTVLNSAFSAVAAIALLEVIIKIAEQIQKISEHAEAARQAWEAEGEAGQKALRSQEEELISLQAKLDELAGDHLAALREDLHLIDMQTFDNLRKQLDELQKAVDAAFDKSKNSGFVNFFNDTNRYVEAAKKDFDEFKKSIDGLADAGNGAGIAAKITEKLTELQEAMKTPDNIASGLIDQKHLEALQQEVSALQNLQKQYDNLNKIRQDKKDIDIQTERNREQKEETSDLTALIALRDQMVSKTQTATQQELASYDAAIAKIQDYKQKWEEAHGGVNVIANQAIEALQKEKKAIEDNVAEMQKLLDMGVVPGLNSSAPDLTAGLDKPIFGGTSDQLQLEKIKTDMQAAASEAQKVRDSIESQNQKFKEQAAILQQLHDEGLLTDREFSAAMQKAAADTDKANKQWVSFGQEIGKDVEQAVIFGKSWTDAFKQILVQIAETIVQMTLLKNIQQSMGGGTGSGGFFSGLLSGLFGGHRASGGFVDSSHAYVVGENGPEMFVRGASGTIVPNNALASGGSSATVNYNIDARGAQPGVEQMIRQAMRETEEKSVARAVVTLQEINRRRVS